MREIIKWKKKNKEFVESLQTRKNCVFSNITRSFRRKHMDFASSVTPKTINVNIMGLKVNTITNFSININGMTNMTCRNRLSSFRRIVISCWLDLIIIIIIFYRLIFHRISSYLIIIKITIKLLCINWFKSNANWLLTTIVADCHCLEYMMDMCLRLRQYDVNFTFSNQIYRISKESMEIKV